MIQNPQFFYQFPCLESPTGIGYNSIIWLTDSQLKKNLEKTLNNDPTLTEADLVKEFVKKVNQIPPDQLSSKYLQARLSRLSVKVAAKLKKTLNNNFAGLPDSRDYWQELFSITLQFIVEPKELLKNFKPNSTNSEQWYSNLQRYAYVKIYGKTIEFLRQQNSSKTLLKTNLALAAKAGKKRVSKLVQNQQILQIWQVFKEVHQAKQINLNNPQIGEFEIIANRYHQLAKSSRVLTGEEVKKILENIGAKVRADLQPSVVFLDAPKNNDKTITWIDSLADPETEEIGDIIQPEKLTEMKRFIQKELETVSLTNLQVVMLLWGLNLKQREIVSELNLNNQPSVTRGKNNVIQSIIKSLQQQGILLKKLDTNLIEQVKTQLETCCQVYQKEILNGYLEQSFSLLPENQQQAWLNYRISNQQSEANPDLDDSREILSQDLIAKLAQKWSLNNPSETIKTSANNYVSNWLENNITLLILANQMQQGV